MALRQRYQETVGPEIGGVMRYPVNLKKDGKFFLAAFPDIPEAITQGETEEEALQAAQEALETALDFYFDDQRTVPIPSNSKRGQRAIELPPSIAAKVILMNEMVRQRVRPAELARRLNTSPQAINPLVNLRYSSKIDGIDEALKALGKTLEVRAV
jgi:antitoxin HicB